MARRYHRSKALRGAKGVDIPALARAGVGYSSPRYSRWLLSTPTCIPAISSSPRMVATVALDFGIMGTLTEVDKNYLAQNFFSPSSTATIAAWRRRTSMPAGCRPTRGSTSSRPRSRGLRAGIRAAAEGNLFRQAAAAPVPGLAALQRRDHPAPARAAAEDAAQHRRPGTPARPRPRRCGAAPSPTSSAGMNEQVGWRGLLRALRREAPFWASTLPQLPRLAHARSPGTASASSAPRSSASRRRTRAATTFCRALDGIHRGADSSRHQPALMPLRTLAGERAAAMMARAC